MLICKSNLALPHTALRVLNIKKCYHKHMKRTPLQSKIPPAIRNRLENDLFMKRCCIEDRNCEGRIEWHHALIFGGKRVNEWWCILPVCTYHHAKEAQFKEELNTVMANRASVEELTPYCKVINYLNYRA